MQNMAGQPAQPGAQGQVQWMQRPQTVQNCPPGLEYLTQVDQLLVHQQVELLEGNLFFVECFFTEQRVHKLNYPIINRQFFKAGVLLLFRNILLCSQVMDVGTKPGSNRNVYVPKKP